MACRMAESLDGEVDVVLVRKLRAPACEELAIGSVSEQGDVHLGEYVARLGVDEAYLRREIRDQIDVLQRRRERYTPVRAPIDPAGRVVVIVDDGIATGLTMLAALHATRARAPARLLAAVGIASREAVDRLELVADQVVCLYEPDDLAAIGDYYADFRQVADEEVVQALRLTKRPRGVHS